MYYLPKEVQELRQQRNIRIIKLERAKVKFYDTELFNSIAFICVILSIVIIMYVLAALN